MKNIIIPFIILPILICHISFGQSKPNKLNDLEKLSLRGLVKWLKMESYQAQEKFGEIVQGQKAKDLENYSISFNSNGKIIEWNNYNPEGGLISKDSYVFDTKGNEIEFNNYNETGELTKKNKSKYDEEGNLIELNQYKSDGSLQTRSVCKYDYEGNIIESITYSPEKNIIGQSTFKYNDHGKIIEEISHDYVTEKTTPPELIAYKIVHKYDDKENEIGWYSYKLNESLDAKTITEFNDNEKITTKYHYNASNVLTQVTKNDSSGNPIVDCLYSEDGSIIYKNECKYDEHGNAIETNEHNFDSSINKYINTFYYDNQGNWIKEIVIKNDIPKSIILRKIEYYTK